jgi:hypothetical protein
MPRYGDADSIRWFEVEPCAAFHIFNCFEDVDDVRKCLNQVFASFHLELILKGKACYLLPLTTSNFYLITGCSDGMQSSGINYSRTCVWCGQI